MISNEFHPVQEWVQAFLFDRKVQNFAAGTITYYQVKLKRFSAYCERETITHLEQITPNTIRAYLAMLEDDGLTVGGRHGHYRAVKTFLRWFEAEEEPQGWTNPFEKVKAPKLPTAPIQPISMQEAMKVVKTCRQDQHGLRDKAIFYTLIDTGIRAAELLNLNLADYNATQGRLLIRMGKGNKTRSVYLGNTGKRALKRYLATRNDDCEALFVSLDERRRLTYSGLRWIVLNRCNAAKVQPRGIHTFRRLHALTMLRAGTDVITLSRLMGHSTTDVRKRYLAQTDDDLREAHAKASPVDHWL